MDKELRTFRPPSAVGLGLPDGLVWPRYGGRSVGNLGPAVCEALDAPDVLLPGALAPGLGPHR